MDTYFYDRIYLVIGMWEYLLSRWENKGKNEEKITVKETFFFIFTQSIFHCKSLSQWLFYKKKSKSFVK